MADIIVTGGTFEKDYNLRTGRLDFAGERSAVHEILIAARALGTHTVRQLMAVDSLDMTDYDRRSVVNACRQANTDKVVVVHGTDTMVETARLVELEELEKAIVFTGAMRPHKLGDSDAGFNLGFALASAQLVKSGVYIAMNSQLLLPKSAQKDRKTLMFTQVEEHSVE